MEWLCFPGRSCRLSGSIASPILTTAQSLPPKSWSRTAVSPGLSSEPQFHYLVDLFFQAATKLPVVTLLPTELQCQSIAESEVASRLCELVATGPRGRLPDLGGPEVLTAGEMAHTWLKLRGLHRRVLPLHVPGKVAQGFRCGYNTCPDQPVRGRITWTEWVQSKYEVQ